MSGTLGLKACLRLFTTGNHDPVSPNSHQFALGPFALHSIKVSLVAREVVAQIIAVKLLVASLGSIPNKAYWVFPSTSRNDPIVNPEYQRQWPQNKIKKTVTTPPRFLGTPVLGLRDNMLLSRKVVNPNLHLNSRFFVYLSERNCRRICNLTEQFC